MIPELISKKNIDVALSTILREGVPSRRRGRDYCVLVDGNHFPPKYTIALAHRVAIGELLSSDCFSGGRESNDFLERRGFDVIECGCGGVRHDRCRSPATARSERGRCAGRGRPNPGHPRLHITGPAPFRSRRIRSIPSLHKALHREGRCLREPELASEQGAPHARGGRRERWGDDLPRSLPGPASPRHLAQSGAQLWVNPSFDNVVDVKWSSILRLRAVENRFFALCTLHSNVNKKNRTHPFAFSPVGSELSARRAGSSHARPLSECVEAGNIYVVDLDTAAAGAPLDWPKPPPATKPQQPRKGRPQMPVQVALRRDHPSVRGGKRNPAGRVFRVRFSWP